MSANAPPADVQFLIDQRPLGSFQYMVLLAGFCLIALDGFDLTCMGFIAPALKAQWHLGNLALGPVLSAAIAGLALGALPAGPMADRFGRRNVLLASLLVIGGFTLMAARAQGLEQLTVLRFLAGLGMGALLPNAATLAAEFAPRRRRSLAVSLAYCGLPVAAAGGGFIAARLIPEFGWQSVLVVGGALPLLLFPLFAWKLPESPVFLAARGGQDARIGVIMQRIAPGQGGMPTIFAVPARHSKQGAARLVASRGYLFGSIMLWFAYLASLFILYLLINWLPTLIKESGFSLTDAALVSGMFQVGGIAGALALGWCTDKLDMHASLAAVYGICALALAGFAGATHALPLLTALAFLLGCCLIGATATLNALAAVYYPTEARATDTSWMHSAGRTGAILSAFAGAQMLGWGWNAAMVLLALVAPALCAGIAVLAQRSIVNQHT